MIVALNYKVSVCLNAIILNKLQKQKVNTNQNKATPHIGQRCQSMCGFVTMVTLVTLI